MKLKLMPFVVYDPNDTPAATPAPEPVAAAPAVPAPAPPQPAPAGDAPWSKDLATLFPDEQVRSQVDLFLRGNVQPHVTQLEQQYAPARELWQDLQAEDQSESVGTYIAVAEQLYGPDVAKAVAESLQTQFAAQQPATPAETPAPAALTPEQQNAIDWAQAQQAEQIWKDELARVSAVDPNLAALDPTMKDKLFAPFVASAGGNFDQALTAFQAWHQTAYPAQPAAPAPAPPTTLPGEGATAAIPPTEPAKQTLDSALDATLAEMRAARGAPATVGQV